MKFSIIVCTYNYAHFLKDALRTLAAQTIQDFELVIVDDGSTDNTEEVAKQCSQDFRNAIYLKKPHTGLADSRNFGINAASGTHLGFLDADDFSAPVYLERIRATFESVPQATLVACDGYRVLDTGEVFGFLFPQGLPPLCGRIANNRELFSFFPYVAPGALIFTKALYAQVGPFDRRYPLGSEDWDWVIRATRSAAFCVRLDEKLFIYRIHGSNLSKNSEGNFLEWLSLYKNSFHSDDGADAEFYSRKMTRKHFRYLLAEYPSRKNRQLLDIAIATHKSTGFLQMLRLLTYFGLPTFSKLARAIKRKIAGAIRSKQKLHLAAAPQNLFPQGPGSSSTS